MLVCVHACAYVSMWWIRHLQTDELSHLEGSCYWPQSQADKYLSSAVFRMMKCYSSYWRAPTLHQTAPALFSSLTDTGHGDDRPAGLMVLSGSSSALQLTPSKLGWKLCLSIFYLTGMNCEKLNSNKGLSMIQCCISPIFSYKELFIVSVL